MILLALTFETHWLRVTPNCVCAGSDFADFLKMEVELLDSVVLVSTVQQCESAVCIHTAPPSWTSLPPSLSHLLGHHRALS